MLFAFRLQAEAQQPEKIPRIGYASTNYRLSPGPLVEAFGQGLRNLGYVDGKNILVEYRYAEGKDDRMAGIVNELVQSNVAVLVVPTLNAVRVARETTKRIPVVMVISEDPVAAGLVDSLARPGGNITGLTRLQWQLSGKRLELLKEAVPRVSRVGVLRDADSRSAAIGFTEYEGAAPALRVQLCSMEVRDPSPDFAGIFKAAANAGVNALDPRGRR